MMKTILEKQSKAGIEVQTDLSPELKREKVEWELKSTEEPKEVVLGNKKESFGVCGLIYSASV